MQNIKHFSLSTFHILFILLCLTVIPVSGKQPLIENWDKTPALPNTWGNTFNGDVQQWVDTTNNELHMMVRPHIPSSGQSRARVRFSDPNVVTSVSTSITIKSINYASGMEDASAQIVGIFYNKHEIKPDGALGDVFASLRVGDRGSGLEAWLFVSESADAEFTEDINPVEIQLANNLNLDTSYTVTFSYDGDNTFTGIISGAGLPETSETIEGPALIGAGSSSFFNNKELRARVWSESGLTTNPDTNKLHAVFGPVSINGRLAGSYDPLTTPLQSSLWRSPEGTATVTGGELKLQVKSAASEAPDNRIQTQVNLPQEYDAYTVIQADLKIDDNPVPTASQTKVELVKGWGNGLHENPGDPEWAGQIVSYSTVAKWDGSDMYSVGCSIEMDDPNKVIATTENYVPIFGGGAYASPNTVYTFTLKRSGTFFTCTIKEKSSGKILVKWGKDLKDTVITKFYAVDHSQFARVRTRVRRSHPGEAIGYVDNICISTDDTDCTGGLNVLFMLPPMRQSVDLK